MRKQLSDKECLQLKKKVILPVIMQKKRQMKGRQKIESLYKAKQEAAGSVQQ